MNEKHISTNIVHSSEIIQPSELSPEEFRSVGDGMVAITLGKDIDGNIIYSDFLKKIVDYTEPSIFKNLHQNEEITMKKNKRVKECLFCLLAILLLQGILIAVFIASYNSELALKRILFATILLGFATCLYAVILPILSLIKNKSYKESDLNTEILKDHTADKPLQSFTKAELDISDVLSESQEDLKTHHPVKRKVPKKQKPKTKKNARKRERKRKNV